MTAITKNKGQKDKLDRFYTPFDEALRLTRKLSDVIDITDVVTFIEPSAGDGAFVCAVERTFPNNAVLALDIAPSERAACKTRIIENDFLHDNLFERELLDAEAKRDDIIVIGNPPFGEQCKLAIDFVNKALEYARYCAFVLPPSFRKETVQSKLDGKVVKVIDIEDCSYRVGNGLIDVPSAFFVMDGTQSFEPIPDLSDKLPFHSVSVKNRNEADFAIRRVGGTSGTAVPYSPTLSKETHYFYVTDEGCPDDIIGIINSCEFPERDWSVGPRSLSQKEIAQHVYDRLVALELLNG